MILGKLIKKSFLKKIGSHTFNLLVTKIAVCGRTFLQSFVIVLPTA